MIAIYANRFVLVQAGQRPGGLVGENQRREGGGAGDDGIARPLSGRKQAIGARSLRQSAVVGQWRMVVVGTDPITDAIPSVSIVFNASASAVLSVGKDSFQTVEFPNSSTTSSNHPAFPSS